MSERIHVLAQQLFGKSSVEDCELQEVKNLAEQYPYFAPAQFLLLEKLKLESSPEYQSQLQKAVLYYHNPLEFEYFISSDKFYAAADFMDTSNRSEKEEPASISERSESFHPMHVVDPSLETNIREETPVIAMNAGDQDIEDTFDTGRQSSEEGNLEVAFIMDPTETPEKIILESDDNEFEERHNRFGEIDKSHEESTSSLVSTALSYSENETIPEPEFSEMPEGNVNDEQQTKPLLMDLLHTKEPTSDTISFEPFHTVDYFASQGIKLQQDEAPKDKFGQQLKSFTEWLKTMKRLPQNAPVAAIDASKEKDVQHLAEDSVHESDVVTEAMAEVWLKQGNTRKALEVYNKLSLQNPAKNAYFAAKIENLNRF